MGRSSQWGSPLENVVSAQKRVSRWNYWSATRTALLRTCCSPTASAAGAGFLRSGLATWSYQTVIAGGRRIEVNYMTITAAGRRAIGAE
jgi:hypothetical protein